MTEGVHERGDLTPAEKEVTLVTSKADDHFVIHAEVATIVSYILDHPAIEVTSTQVEDGDVVAATGNCPRGLVKLQSTPRNTDRFSGVVSSGELRGRDDE